MLTKPITDVIAGTRRWSLQLGDCLAGGRLLPDQSIDFTLCDPPYGVSWKGKGNKQRAILNDDHPFIWWLHDAFRATKSPGAIAVFCPWKLQHRFHLAIETAGFVVRSQVIWDRKSFGMGNCYQDFAPSHDVIWFATKGRYRFPGKRLPSVLRVPNIPSGKRLHSTEKPLDLLRQLITTACPAGGVVYDPTCGSGSAGHAALVEGRRFLGFELDQVNYQTATQRLRRLEFNRKHTATKPLLRSVAAVRPAMVAA